MTAPASSPLPDLAGIDNPFGRPVVDGPRDVVATAESIHRAEFERILRAFARIEGQAVPRLKRGPLALLVLSQMPGSGKSHLLARLWKALNGRAIVIFLRAHQDSEAFWRRILERLVQELQHPEATDRSVQAAGSTATQLDALARHLLADLMEKALQQGSLKAPRNIGQIVRTGTPAAMAVIRQKLPEFRTWLTHLVPLWIQQLATAGIQLQRDTGAWLKVLTTYTLHQPGETERSLALDWLVGHELASEEAARLGLTAAQARSLLPAPGMEGSHNETAFQCIKDLCALSAFFRPVVFAFDQTEIYGQSAELAHAFGATVGRLQAECINQLTVVTANEQPWNLTVSRHFERADLDRFDPTLRIVIRGIDRRQAEELVTVKLRSAGCTPEQAGAFIARPWLDRLFASQAAAPVPRDVERAACAAFEAWAEGEEEAPASTPPAPPQAPDALLEETLQSHVRRLKSTPRALDFDVVVFLWLFNHGLSRMPGIVVKSGFGSSLVHLHACWQAGNRTVFFVFDPSNHWSHWRVVVRDFHAQAQQLRQQAQEVRGIVLRHRSLKALGDGVRNQLRAPEAEGLALAEVTDEEMALLYGAQALYADVCQGDLPGVDQAALLAFLGERLRDWAWRFSGLGDAPDAVAPSAASPAEALPPMSAVGTPETSVTAPADPPSREALPPPPNRDAGPVAKEDAIPSTATTSASAAKPTVVHLGTRQLPPATPVELRLALLARHTAVLGGSGSGKTTAALRIIEQALEAGIPAVLLDRKGDLCRYADPAAWHDPHWPPGLHFDPDRRTRLRDRLAVSLYTPGALQGRSLRMPLAPANLAELPLLDRDQAASESAAVFAQALGLGKADDAKKAVLVRCFQLLAGRVQGRGIELDDLLGILRGDDPELAEAVDMLPPRQIQGLAARLQAFGIVSGAMQDARAELVDWAAMFRPDTNGRTRLSIISTRSLGSDEAALAWVAQLFLELLRHVARHPSAALQGLVMIDEADIYLPATRAPATKLPLESLLKRARSGGVGLMLCTQSPGDLDYKGRDNIRTWLLGLITQERARQKLEGVLEESRIRPELLGKLKTGQFVLATEGQAVSIQVAPNLVKTEQMAEADIIRLAAQAKTEAGPHS